jgi:hypothetical protein
MIVTKTHFIFLIESDRVSDLLYEPKDKPSGNPIGFLIHGTANAFVLNANSDWDAYTSIQTPNLHIRSKNSLLGAVATDTEVLYATIIPRQDSLSGYWSKLNNASGSELETIQNTQNTFIVSQECKIESSRDLHTFKRISTIINTVNDDEIEIDGI